MVCVIPKMHYGILHCHRGTEPSDADQSDLDKEREAHK